MKQAIRLVLSGLEDSIMIGDDAIKINTDFRNFLQYQLGQIEKNSDKFHQAILGICPNFYDFEKDDRDLILKEIAKFSNPEVFTKKDGDSFDLRSEMRSASKRDFDLFQDFDTIICDFYREYKIDLLDGSLSLHWHRFLILKDGISSNSSSNDRRKLRAIDIKDVPKAHKKGIQDAQAYHALDVYEKEENSLEKRNARWHKYVKMRTDENNGEKE